MRKTLPTNMRDFEALRRTAMEEMQAGSLLANHLRPLWPAPYNEPTYESRRRFVFDVAFTWHEQERKAMRFPEMEYLEFFIWHWHHTRAIGQPLIVHKSRRIIISWCARALELHDMGLAPGSQMLADSTFAKAENHIWRYYFMYERIREAFPSWKLLEGTAHGSVPGQELEQFIMPNGAIFQALNSDAGKIQGAGLAGVTLEELSQYRYMDQMWSQAQFVTQSTFRNGHVVALSNSSPRSAWKKMKAQSSIKRKPDVAETEPPFGCNVYRTDGDVRVITIHYTADPDKKDPAWRMKNMGSMSPAEWNREMELDEETIAGEVVYPEFVPTKHGHPHIADVMKRRRPQDINASTLWIAGVDAGNTQHPAAVLLEITPTGQIIAIAEVPPPMGASGYTMAQFAPLMQRTWQKKIPSRFTEIDYWADMTVNHHMGGESVAVIAKRLAGIVFHAMSNAPEARHAAVIWALTDTLPGDDEAPRFLVDKEACPFLYEALSGGYCYALPGRSDDTNAQAKPVKNRYADIADALQYGLMRCQQIIRTYEARMFVGGATMDSIWQSIKDPQMQQTTPPKRRDYRRRRM